MKTGTAVLMTVVALAVGLAAGATFLADGDGAGRAGDAANGPDRTEELETTIARLREELAAKERVEAEPPETPLAPPPPESPSEGPAPDEIAGEEKASDDPETGSGPRYYAEEYGGILKEVDWTEVGGNMRKMVPIIRDVATSIRAGETPDMDKVGEIQRLNGPLVQAALKVREALPGLGVNGKFSSPPFMLNAIHAALEAAGRPLDEDQAKRLVAIADRHRDLDEKRIRGYDERTWTLVRLVEEAEQKARFFDDVFATLTAEQALALSPPETRDRIRLDIFSEGLIYVTTPRPLPFGETSEVVEEMVRGCNSTFRLREDQKAVARETIEEWVRSLPDGLLFAENDPRDFEGILDAGRVTDWIRRTIPFLRSLADRAGFDTEQVKRVRNLGYVVVPLRKP